MHNSLPLVAAAAAAAGGCRYRSVLGNGCIRKQHYEAHGVGAAGLAQPPHGVPQERGDAVQVDGNSNNLQIVYQRSPRCTNDEGGH